MKKLNIYTLAVTVILLLFAACGDDEKAVTGITLNKATLALTEGNAEILTATVFPTDAANKTVSWTSSNAAIATVADGMVTGGSAGAATITVTTADGGYAATCTVTVEAAMVAVESVSLDQATLTVLTEETETLTATVLPPNATNQTIIWTTSNANVATVVDGAVTGVSTGSATITATTADGGKTDRCVVTVSQGVVHVESVSVSPTAVSVPIGESVTLTATVLPETATNKSVTWKSNSTNASVVNGTVTGLAEGTAVITVTTNDGKKIASCDVTITACSVEIAAADLSGTMRTWEKAKNDCAALGDGWRLPTKEELECMCRHPGDRYYAPSSPYWSATEDPNDPTKAYLVSFSSDGCEGFTYLKTYAQPVRCVK